MDMNTLKQLITEAVQNALEEADYPADFDLATFKKLPSFPARLKYIKTRLPKVAQGSSRAVFIADPNTVIKVAMNNKGIAQNEVEADIGRTDNNYPIAKVFEVGDNGLWIEMERAEKVSARVFKQLAGVDRGTLEKLFREYHYYKKGGKNIWGKPPNYDELMWGEHEFINQLRNLFDDYDMPYGDLVRYSSWGVVTRDGQKKLVLIDFGLTQTVYQDFYAR